MISQPICDCQHIFSYFKQAKFLEIYNWKTDFKWSLFAWFGVFVGAVFHLK